LPSLRDYENNPVFLLAQLMEERAKRPFEPLDADAVKLYKPLAEDLADVQIMKYPVLKALKLWLVGWYWSGDFVKYLLLAAALGVLLFNGYDLYQAYQADNSVDWIWPLVKWLLLVLLLLLLIFLLFGALVIGFRNVRNWMIRGNREDRKKHALAALINRCIDVLHQHGSHFFDFKLAYRDDGRLAVAFLNKTRQPVPDRVAKRVEALLNKQTTMVANNGHVLSFDVFFVEHDLLTEEELQKKIERMDSALPERQRGEWAPRPEARNGRSDGNGNNGPGGRNGNSGNNGPTGHNGRPHHGNAGNPGRRNGNPAGPQDARRPGAGKKPGPQAPADRNGGAQGRTEGATESGGRQANPELERALAVLNGLTGLKNVKKRVEEICHAISLQEVRKKAGQQVQDQTMHMLFLGNPGTGKTTVARIVADIFKALGVLSQGQLVEVTREDLVGEHIGETAVKTANVVKSALGGVLFIDEAYSLYSDSERDFGREAINTLIKYMEDYRRDLIVIMAGYTQEMNQFLKMNSGIKSRFASVVEFEDYTPDELLEIFDASIRKQGFEVDDACRAMVRQLFEKKQLPGRKDNGNARLVRHVIEDAIRKQSARLAERMAGGLVTEEEIKRLVPEDFGLSAEGDEKPFDLEAELARIVGHEQVKQHIRELHNLLIVQKNRKEQGLGDGGIGSLHMVFKGNPGTGKTTIARLIARLLKELGLLKSGHLVETDRSGLVAQYVGQTAAKVKNVVDEALGGVLFIDEAYSLYRDDFGKEAIDALVKSMEDHRENLVVIVAGYSEEMDQFLDTNPGLRSRFPTTFEFPDYSPDDIWHILQAMCAAENYVLEDGCEAVVKELYGSVAGSRDAGNGRFARNLFERAKIKQATRIRTLGAFDRTSLSTLVADDFVA